MRDGSVIAARLRRRAGRAARDPGQLRRVPGRARSARARAHRHRQPQGRIQPRARLLHRGHATPTSQQIPDDYRRRQTLKNAERYITPELKTFEDKALSAQERALAREKTLYDELLAALAPAIDGLQRAALALAIARRVHRARRAGRRRCAGRSRVFERTSRASRSAAAGTRSSSSRSRHFIPNDLVARRRAAHADRHRPEHGRQVDLHAAGGGHRAARVLRAVRAGDDARDRAARCDPYTRIGAADDLAGGRSTFMVEMTEAAYILQPRDAAAAWC